MGRAPSADDRGPRRGYRPITGGRAAVRSVLFMAAHAASRENPALTLCADRLRAAGKKPKVVLIAGARKRWVLANAILQRGKPGVRTPTAAGKTG